MTPTNNAHNNAQRISIIRELLNTNTKFTPPPRIPSVGEMHRVVDA